MFERFSITTQNRRGLRRAGWTLALALAAGFSLGLSADRPGRPAADGVNDALPPIPFKTGPAATQALAPAQIAAVLQDAAAAGQRHVVLQFRQPVADAERAALSSAGVTLQSYLSANAFFAALDTAALRPDDAAKVANLAFASPAQRNWKLHPTLAARQVAEWAIVPPIGTRETAVNLQPYDELLDAAQGEDISVGAYVLFHPDVPAAEAHALAWRHGAFVRSELSLIGGLVIELPYGEIFALADRDEVLWIEPPLPPLDVNNNSNRTRVGADIVFNAPYNLTGAGVNVMVYDGGTASNHVDFQGRMTVRDTSGNITHATHVSGTIGGAGVANAQYRGIAPGVTIQSYGFEQEGGLRQGFLYTDPGDIQADYTSGFVTHGTDIANNSIGTNTAPNGYPCDWEGNYGVTDVLIDSIVRGSLGFPTRIVWANGNERGAGRCGTTYHTTAPPACAKNHCTVGALNSNDDSMTNFSSWGPADDDRLKPDISGPGCQSNDDQNVTSCSGTNGYTGMCGTSMSCPTVTGMGSLLLQDFRAHFPDRPDFRNSTLRILLAHTAVDLGNPGPDYQFGYGSVRIQPAIDFMRTGNFLEAEVVQGETYRLVAIVAPGDTALKVTLAWDDVPGTPLVSPALVNDLDLRVFNAANEQFYPWTLGGLATPAAPAVRTQADHINNIEQVFVPNPPPGVYFVEVLGFNVPQGPQPFSICASPVLINCSSRGVLSVDRQRYNCGSTTIVQVVDCDLNVDDNVIDTGTVNVASNTTPAGVNVVITETGTATSAFAATLPLSADGAPGTLRVSNGDTLTVTYIDADNGQGGTNVPVTALAVVDCAAATISGVQVSNVGPRSATVSFTTNEPDRKSVV